MQLYPYQKEGAEWLAGKRHALLADEMGLGKTIQAIKAAQALRPTPHTTLIVCPASLVYNWRKELLQGGVAGAMITLCGRGMPVCEGQINIISYDRMLREHDMVRSFNYGLIICDEAHYLKNVSAKRTKAFYGFKGKPGIAHKAQRVWLLTGTPMPNNPSELYPHCRVLFSEQFKKDDKYMNKAEFIARFCRTKFNGFADVVVGGKNMDELESRLKPIMLRRTVSEVLTELPPITISELRLGGHKLRVPRECLKVLNEMDASASPLAVIRKHADSMIELRRLLGEAKVNAVLEWIALQFEEGLKNMVVFAHHRNVMDQLQASLQQVGRSVVRIDGTTPSHLRQQAVEEFQAGEADVFLGNIVAAGTGITLTAANTLLFAEYSWVPGENEQALKRIHRIGQDYPANVYYAVAENSLDLAISRVVWQKEQTITQLFKR